MVTLIILILAFAIILSFGLMVKSPKYGLWLYKGAILGIMIIALFIALFFYLGGTDVSILNINLHPWKNFLRYRVFAGVACVTVIFAISQLPLFFAKCYVKKKKWQIIKCEGLLYAVVLIIGVVCLSQFSGIGELHDEKLQAGNEVVRLIDEYNKTHEMQCQSLSELGLKPAGDNFYEYKGMWFLLEANDKAFILRFCSPYGGDINYDFTYSSDVQEWDDTIERYAANSLMKAAT